MCALISTWPKGKCDSKEGNKWNSLQWARLSGLDFLKVQQVNGAGVGGYPLVERSSENQTVRMDVHFTRIARSNAHSHLEWNGALQCV